MKKLITSAAISALLCSTALMTGTAAAQTNLEKLGAFKITGTKEHTVVDQSEA